MPNWKAARMKPEAAMLLVLSSELARNEKKRARNASCLRLPSVHRLRRAPRRLRRAARRRSPAQKREPLPPERPWPGLSVLVLSASCSHLADLRGQSLRWIDPTPLDAAAHGMVAESRSSVVGMPLLRQKKRRQDVGATRAWARPAFGTGDLLVYCRDGSFFAFRPVAGTHVWADDRCGDGGGVLCVAGGLCAAWPGGKGFDHCGNVCRGAGAVWDCGR